MLKEGVAARFGTDRIWALFCAFAALATTAWSLKTTWMGFNLVVKDELGAGVFSSVVQIWLLGVSFILGADLTRRFLDLPLKRNRLSLTVFLWFCFVITFSSSVLFSYVNFVKNTFGSGQSELVEESDAKELTQRIMAAVTDEVGAARRASMEDLLKKPEVAAWLADMDKVQKAADDPDNQKAFATKAVENKQTFAQLNNSVQNAEDALQKKKDLLQKRQNDLKDTDQRTKDLQTQKENAAKNKRDAERKRDNELNSATATDGKSGKGDIYARYDKDAARYGQEEAQADADIRRNEQARSNVQKDVDRLKGEIISDDTALSALRIERDEAGRFQTPNPGSQSDSRLAAEYATAMKNYIIAFRTDPTTDLKPGTRESKPGTYEQVVARCNTIVGVIKPIAATSQSALVRDAAKASCNPSEVSLAVKTRSDALPDFEAFAKECTAGLKQQALSRLISQKNEQKLKSALDNAGAKIASAENLIKGAEALVQPCVDSAPAISNATRQGIQRQLNDFVESHVLGDDQLKTAIQAFLRDPRNAAISMIFAVFQDLFVLVAGIGAEFFKRREEIHGEDGGALHIDLSVQPDDPPGVAARKILLRLAIDEPGGFYIVDMNSPAWKDHDGEHGANMMLVLRGLRDRDLARLIPYGDGQAYRVTRHGYQELTREVAKAARNASAQRFPSPRTTGAGTDNRAWEGARGPRSRREVIEDMTRAPGAGSYSTAPAGDRSQRTGFAKPAPASGIRDNSEPAQPASTASRQSAERPSSGREFLDRLRGGA